MSVSAAAAAIGGGLQLASSVGSNAYNQGQTNKARSWSEKMYAKQLQDNLRMSSPQFQIERLRQSGLNPNLMYQGEQTTSPSSYSNSEPFSGGYDVSKLADTSLIQAQIDNIKADTDLKKADAKKRGVETDTLEAQLSVLPQRQQLELDNLRADFDKKLSDITVNDWTISKIETEIKEIYAQVDNIMAETDLIAKQSNKTTAEIDAIRNNIKLSYSYLVLAKNDQELKSINLGLQDYGLQLTEKGIEIQNQQFYDKLAQDKDLQEKLYQEMRYRSNVEVAKLLYDPFKAMFDKMFNKKKPVGFGRQ